MKPSELHAVGLVGILSVVMTLSEPVAAGTSFIQTWLDGQGGCGNTGSSPLAFVLAGADRSAPFGKALAEWSDQDLIDLKAGLLQCERTAAARGNPYFAAEIHHQITDVLEKVPALVMTAREEEQARIRQLDARKAIARSRILKAARDKEAAKASTDAEVSRLESEANLAEAEAARLRAEADRRVQKATQANEAAKAKAAEAAAALQSESDTRARAGTGNVNPPPPSAAESDGELRELPDRGRPSSSN